MGTASSGEWIAILLYFALVIGVGVYFFFRDRHQEGEKEYFLGGRSMGGWVAALSAGASDMSAWVLMGLPGSIYLYGIGKVWIAVGVRRAASAPVFHPRERLDHDPAVSHQSLPVEEQGPADHLGDRVRRGLLHLQRLEHLGLRHAVQHRHGHERQDGQDYRHGHHPRVRVSRRLQRRVLDGLLPGHAHACRAHAHADPRAVRHEGCRLCRTGHGRSGKLL